MTYRPGRKATAERRLGWVPIADVCTVGRHAGSPCTRPAEACMPDWPRGEPPRVLWLCADHAHEMDAAVAAAGDSAHTSVRALVRTCGMAVGADDPPCGALATAVVMFGLGDGEGRPLLRLASVCPRHAELERL
jgi:hypothetical protein